MRRFIVSIVAVLVMTSAMNATAEDRFNVRTNPLTVFSTEINLEVDIRLGERYALAPVVQFNSLEPEYQAGFRLSRYEQQAFQGGWLFSVLATGGQVYEVDFYYDESDKLVEEKLTGWRAVVALNQAYQWRWETFNTAVGLGARVEHDANRDETSLHSDVHFTIGWAY